jgi:hypothetical protein
MRTYYRGPDAVVTSAVFAGRAAATPYAIRELRNARITRTEHRQPTVAHVAAGLLGIAAAAWPLWKASPLYALALVALGVPALAVGVMIWPQRQQCWELWATYRGVDVALYSSTDERVFNQVARALRRAIEDSHPPAAWNDLAVA